MKRLLAALCCILVVVSAVPAPAVAQEDTGDRLIDAVSDADASEFYDAWIAGITGLTNRISDSIAARSDDSTASDYAGELRTTWNANNDTLRQYVNARAAPTASSDVLELTLELDESATLYLVGNVSNGSYTRLEMVNSTSRTVDETCTLRENAARNVVEELELFVEDYAKSGDDVTAAYMARLASQYQHRVECSFLEGDD